MMPRHECWATAWERVARRTADILIAGTALLVLSPLMAIIAVAIKSTSPGPALFTQRRVGLGPTAVLLLQVSDDASRRRRHRAPRDDRS